MRGRSFTVGLTVLQRLMAMNPWHFLWISIVLSELFTSAMGLLLKGSVTWDYLLTGGVVSLLVAGLVIFMLKVMMQVRLDNKTLREEVEFHSLLMETIPDILYVLDTSGNLIKWNRRAEEFSGYSRDEMDGRSALDFIAEEDREEARAGLKEAHGAGTASRELLLLTKDGRKVLHRFSGAVIRDAAGRFIGFVGIGRDISGLKKIEEEMSRAQKLESVGLFASGVAYDFTTLLSIIVENVRLAIMNADQRETLRLSLLKAERASLRAKDMTKQLYALSRSAFPFKRAENPGIMVRECASSAVFGSSVACDFVIGSDLWNVEVDAGQIQTAVGNIVRNAVEAMPGGGALTIEVCNAEVRDGAFPSAAGGRYVKISVKDCGEGLPDEHFQKIFDPYFTTKPERSGMGLAISYSVVRNHKGHIRVESEMGKGTVFHIYLPAAAADPAAGQPR